MILIFLSTSDYCYVYLDISLMDRHLSCTGGPGWVEGGTAGGDNWGVSHKEGRKTGGRRGKWMMRKRGRPQCRPLLLVAGRATLELHPTPQKWTLHFLFSKYQLLVCNISMPVMASVWYGRSATKKKKSRMRKEVESHWSLDAIMHVS